MKAELRRVAFGEKVLLVDVCDVDVLLSPVEAVESAVRVLLKLREVCEVELIAVVSERAEEACAEVVVGEDEAAEVGDEGLYADAQTDGVVVRVHVFEFDFGEGVFQREVPVRSARAAARVYVDDALLARADVVRQAEGGRDFYRPLSRLERRVAAEHLEGEL